MTTTPIELTGPTPEEAIITGLEQLNLPREAVEIEIIDEGSKGLFGLGSRDAIVRLTPLENLTQSVPLTDTPLSETQDKKPQSLPSPTDESEETSPSTQDQEKETEEDYILSLARDTVSDLIQKMRVDAEVIARYQEQADEDRNRPSILVEVNGDDLSILIGRQAETLNALQFITRLIIGKELSQGIDLQVDVQGYRARRAEQLQRIAHQMADQAIRTGKRQYLEPMPSDDRRLIHIALRNHPDVTTESMGEGNRRKVTILPR